MSNYINVTDEAGKRFYMDYHEKGKITMLNLLKFKEQADYTNLEDIKPSAPITGEEAYHLYMKYTRPHLKEAGGKVLYFGTSSNYVIGPENEKWDVVLLVQHESVTRFMEFAQNKEYLKTAGHRTAALADSRLLPTLQQE